jgi:cation:H+ antiporter
MLLAAATILFGFIMLIWSADLFVDGAASIAHNMGMSPIIIGLTIVSLGTSAPEILVSLTASTSGAGTLAIGNAIGSNIANIALVLGVTVLVAPLMIQEKCMTREVPVLLVATLGVGWLILDGVLSQRDGWLMVAVLIIIAAQLVRSQFRSPELIAEAVDEPAHDLAPLRAWITFFIGLVVLIVSSKMLVWGAVHAAKELGVSELVIGLTIVAIGTSLPELAATIASAMRGHTEIALGNIIGSNLFNLLAVMSIPGIVATQPLEPAIISRDYATMTFLTLFLIVAIYVSRKRSKSSPGHAYLGRILGTILVSFYALYYYLLHITL